MDAKSKANFINSVIGSQKKPCPVCNALSDMDALFCMSCGNKLPVQESTAPPVTPAPAVAPVTAQAKTNTKPAFNAVKNEDEAQKQSEANGAAFAQSVFQSVPVAATIEPEEISVFAQGLPAWDVVPPQIMVRRKKK